VERAEFSRERAECGGAAENWIGVDRGVGSDVTESGVCGVRGEYATRRGDVISVLKSVWILSCI